MDEQTTWTLALSREEFYLLAAMMQAPPPMGVEDPFQRATGREGRERLERVKEGLARRGYVEEQPDGSLALDAAVAALVQVATASQRSVVVSFARANGSAPQRFIHLAPELIVEQQTDAEGKIELTAVRDLETLAERMRSFLNLGDVSQAPGAGFALSETEFSEAQRLALDDEVSACAEYLRGARVPDEAAAALSDALSKGQHAGSAMVWQREAEGTKLGESVSWLVGARGGWLLRRIETPEPVTVQFAPATGQDIEQGVCPMLKP